MGKHKIWDTKEKGYLNNGSYPEDPDDLVFTSLKEADDYRDEYLAMGYYPDEPNTVLRIDEVTNN